MRGLRLWSLSSLWTIGLKKRLFSCASVCIKVPSTKTAGWAQIPLVLLFCFGLVLLKSFLFFLCCCSTLSFPFFPDGNAPTGMNVSETYGGSAAWGIITHMLVIQNIFTIFHDALFSLAACNLEHLFTKMLRLVCRGDHRTPVCISEVTVTVRVQLFLFSYCFAISIYENTHTHTQINTMLKVVRQTDTTHSLMGVNMVSFVYNYFSCKINLQSLGKSTLY